MSALTKIATALALLLSLGAQAAEGAGEATEDIKGSGSCY